ncbi:MAG: DUF6245 family protein [Solirubrobacteraceae bacterium]
MKSKPIAAGGENVLAAVLANALYGASIGCGMLAEGQMLEQPTNQAQRLSPAVPTHLILAACRQSGGPRSS